MLTLLAALMLTSPAPQFVSPCDEYGWPVESVAACRKSCAWWDRHDERCRDVDVEVIGTWDPRPAPQDWSSGFYTAPQPPAFGAYPTEQRQGQTYSGARE